MTDTADSSAGLTGPARHDSSPGPATLGQDGTSAAGQDTADLAQIRRANRGTLIERMGIEILQASSGLVVGTMPVLGNTQPYGLLHGGASVALAETLGSYGAMLHAGPGRQAVGIEVSATHHRAARSGLVTGRAVALHLGRTVASYEIVVEDSTSRRVCTARLTCLVMAARRPD
ncbi:MAG: thioesterase superfamily protein [Actinotalea sp.]|nr:thioesterase superfamily protein [Actinotalea sp.]